jgi:hypothetical protein
MKKRFEEILEECLSAQFEGRRTLEESLSLYPSLAPELEPLLRTAGNVSHAFDGLNPPAYLLERGRLRFVAASSERRRAREIAYGVNGFGRKRMPWNFRHWGMLSSGVAAACALVIVGAIAVLGGDGGGREDVVQGQTPSPTAPSPQFAKNLEDLIGQLNHVKLKAGLGTVGPEDLRALQRATEALAASGQPPDDASRQAAERALSEQYATALELSQTAPPEQAGEYQEVLNTTQAVANTLDVDLFPVEPTPVAATQTPAETPAPTDAPTPTAPATETPAPTEAPTPTPTLPPLQGVE